MLKIGTDNGMGLVRYILSIAVLIAHFNYITGADYFFPVSSYHAVGGFFALSGFLVYQSYEKSGKFSYFIKRRALKIMPPYLFIVLTCAFLLGFTIHPHDWESYFSVDWLKYVGANITFLNFLHPSLKDVFDGQAINGSLWTIKIEWLLYISVPIVVWIINKFSIKKEYVFFIILYVCSALYRKVFLWLYDLRGLEIYSILSRQIFGQLCYFYTGVMIFKYYEYFRRKIIPVIIIAVFMIAISQINNWMGIFCEPLGVSVLTIGVSMSLRGWLSIFNKNNASYEIYLFHMPVIQLIWSYREKFHLDINYAFVLSIALTIAIAFICWFCLDKPILNHKKR